MQFRPGVPQPANQQQLAAVLEHVALPGKVKHRSWRDAGGIRAWNRRSMRWKVMAWTGCARMAGQASNAPWVSRPSQPTCTGSDACCSNGRSGGTIARTHHPIVWRPSRPHPQYPSFPPLGTDSARPESEQENIIRTFGAPMGGLPVIHLLNQHDPLSGGYHHVA